MKNIKVFVLKVPEDFCIQRELLLEYLSPQRKQKAQKINHKESFYNCALSELILKKAIGVLPCGQIEYTFNDSGKPYLCNTDVFFNLSHTSGYILCAVSRESEVGADIQSFKQTDFEKTANRWFCPQNAKEIISAHSCSLFFEMWTAKESVVKCAGFGINNNFKDLCLTKTDTGYTTRFSGKDYVTKTLNIDKNVCASIAFGSIYKQELQNSTDIVFLTVKDLIN